MVWEKPEIQHLISLWREKSVLWDANHKEHHRNDARSVARRQIAVAVGKPINEIVKKLHSLRSQYGREQAKIAVSVKSSSAENDVYTPKWPFYEELSFLREKKQSIPNSELQQLQNNSGRGEITRLNESSADTDAVEYVQLEAGCKRKANAEELIVSAMTILDKARVNMDCQNGYLLYGKDETDAFCVLVSKMLRRIKDAQKLDRCKLDLLQRIIAHLY
ncbi:uncharacterized protein TRIADDRAFT_51596 [Trichoplax adhaerens]|uniref:MADF domain-containing protein n=1 Tax=Trichoplax adhaerens TaxID=10228 RepID=B3RK22_TRIAD|nr:hypothetical protein TRIADDRAFT_51596 [Trichoplax adhaerens]EDV29361.1 hypothetical protein TRIADDRAFT_51596 [Trichoplax adhaerens]|eukprot:XP_002108563.1 hypothetical protein TRIADDRAFT_51596 [Trichoplax adhaerens]